MLQHRNITTIILRRILNTTTLAVLFGFLFAQTAQAELPASAYAELKKKSPEKLQIEIVKVTTKKIDDKRMAITYIAKVKKVTSSKTQTKAKEKITITASRFTVPFAGPSPAPILKKGWKGKAYLRASVDKKTKEKKFKLAAYGQSFE